MGVPSNFRNSNAIAIVFCRIDIVLDFPGRHKMKQAFLTAATLDDLIHPAQILDAQIHGAAVVALSLILSVTIFFKQLNKILLVLFKNWALSVTKLFTQYL